MDAEELLVHERGQREAVKGLHASVVHSDTILGLTCRPWEVGRGSGGGEGEGEWERRRREERGEGGGEERGEGRRGERGNRVVL